MRKNRFLLVVLISLFVLGGLGLVYGTIAFEQIGPSDLSSPDNEAIFRPASIEVEIETIIEIDTHGAAQCLLLSNPAVPCGGETTVIDFESPDDLTDEFVHFEVR